jgi:hypothetical protein
MAERAKGVAIEADFRRDDGNRGRLTLRTDHGNTSTEQAILGNARTSAELGITNLIPKRA